MHVYDLNLRLLGKKNSALAFRLRTTQALPISPQRSSFPASHAQVLCILNMGNEKWCQRALNWVEVNRKRRLLLLESDLGVLQRFLSWHIAEKILQHPRIVVASSHVEESVQHFICSHVYQVWECIGKEEMRQKIFELILEMECMISLYRDFGIPQLVNLFSNLIASNHVYCGEALFNQFTHIPAIICGAGPSLEHHFPVLRDLTNRALIFGGGSALIPLKENGVCVHFATELDPYLPQERCVKHSRYEVPLFYQNQLSHSLFLQSRGPKLCLGDNGNFPLEKWLDLPLSPFDGGWNSATFATQIAYKLGCDPIIFVGMDLCISGGRSYAGKLKELRDNPITCVDRFGKSVKTRLDFFMAKKWLEILAKTHSDRTFLNATTAGLALEGIRNVPLVVEGASYDLISKVRHAIMGAPLLGFSHVSDKLQKLYASLNQCMGEFVAFRDTGFENEIFYQAYLLPLWKVWKYLLQTEETEGIITSMEHPDVGRRLQKLIFFKEVTKNFKKRIKKLTFSR